MPHDHWSDYHTRWARLGPPLRPDPDVATAVRDALYDAEGPALLLGVTPELADVAYDVTAVDKSEAMIAGVWPGDAPHRRAVRADWRKLPLDAGRFAAAVGDGSLNALVYPGDYERLFAELSRVVRPQGRAIFRVFVRPVPCEPVDAVVADAASGGVANFHAFKWRLAMARAAELGAPNIGVEEILGAFERAVPDRAEFSEKTAFLREDVDTIDVYRGSAEIYSFPSRAELRWAPLGAFTPPRFVAVGEYPLADRCPLVVFERR